MHLDTEEHEVELLDVKRNKWKGSSSSTEDADLVDGEGKTTTRSLNDWKVTAAEYDELFEYLGAFQVADRTVKVKSEQRRRQQTRKTSGRSPSHQEDKEEKSKNVMETAEDNT